MFRSAAVPLIEPHDIEARSPRLVGDAAHVVRLAGTFQTVQGENRRTTPAVALPMAVRQHARVRRHLEDAAVR